MTQSYSAQYRGQITGLSANGSRLVFATRHPEEQATGVSLFDVDSKKFDFIALDCGVTAQLLVDDTLWVAGTDKSISFAKLNKAPRKAKVSLQEEVIAFSPTRDGVALITRSELVLLSNQGDEVTRFEVGEPLQSLACDPGGTWLVVGTARGSLVIYHDESGFREESRARLHDGAVTALCFAPDELRVYSTGTDRKLLLSFVRGSLDTEDRGGTNTHDRPITSLIIGPDFETEEGTFQRFYTAGLDSALKSWPRSRTGSQRPSTHTDKVVQSHFLTLVTLNNKVHLAQAGLDSTIRLFSFDEQGRVNDHVFTLWDGYSLARVQLESSKPAHRKQALSLLGEYCDEPALKELRYHLFNRESDHKLQVFAAQTLAKTGHKKAAEYLEELYSHPSEDVRAVAFDGLVSLKEKDDLAPLRLAIRTGFEDLGLAAVDKLKAITSTAARELLKETLNHQIATVRNVALLAMEAHFGDDPEGTLSGLNSTYPDLRRMAIVRLERRGLLDNLRVSARLRRLFDDPDLEVRNTAFLAGAMRQPNLVKALRFVDERIHRWAVDFEEFEKPADKRKKELPKAKKFGPQELVEEDLRPLLEAMASRSVDICLLGARGLAALGDPRATATLLQLSQEKQPATRIEACHALAISDDRRATDRLRALLLDSDSGVRDAAFSALTSLQSDAPLDTVSAALDASEADVRTRALQLLMETIRQTEKRVPSDRARALLLVAINDSDAALRLEAFKSVLNLELDGGGAQTLTFLLQSAHKDVRREALQEAKAHHKNNAFQAVLFDIVDDPESDLAIEALDFVLERLPTKMKEEVFRRGLQAAQETTRLETLRRLEKEKDKALWQLLTLALEDKKRTLRLAAVQALVRAESSAQLKEALQSPHQDVRVEAAAALASLGDESALSGLLEVIDQWQELGDGEHAKQERQALLPALLSAIQGIENLGDPQATPALLSILGEDEEKQVAQAAARALPWVVDEQHFDQLEAVLKHSQSTPRARAALGFAINGDGRALSQVLKHCPANEKLLAALMLREESEELLLSFADRNDSTGCWALRLILLLELAGESEVPDRTVALLATTRHDVRLKAAKSLETYGDKEAFAAFVTEVLNENFASLKLTGLLTVEDTRRLAAVISRGQPRQAARAAWLLQRLDESSSEGFEKEWALFQERFASDIDAAMAHSPKTAPLSEQKASAWSRLKARVKGLVTIPQDFDDALTSLAFGAYVGLTRRDAGGTLHNALMPAITGLKRLATREERFREDACRVLLVTLSDASADVRARTFDALLELNAPNEVLATEALATGYPDMGFRGLELLVSDEHADGNALLEQTMLSSTNGLEEEASKLLAQRIGEIATYRIALGAESVYFRQRALRGLEQHYGNGEEAKEALHQALESSFDDIRRLAATTLARHKDGKAFSVLSDMVDSSERDVQLEGIWGVRNLGDKKGAQLLLDRIENDRDKSAVVDELLEGALSFQDPSIAPRLLGWIDADKNRDTVFDAALRLTGYPQLLWYEDDEGVEKNEKNLTSRHPEVFTELLELAYRIADESQLSQLVPLAKWPPASDALDNALNPLLQLAHPHVRHKAVEVAGWRLKHRSGPAERLIETLNSADVLDQFFAAEGLALSGHSEGLPVLQTAVDVMDDFTLRQRAVLAIGHLAQESTVDMLISMAEDDTHLLQEAAAEAIGHMSRSDRSQEIFAILSGFLDDDGGYNQVVAAIKGLRWFNTPASWELLQKIARSDSWMSQQAIGCLRFDENSRETLADLVRTREDWRALMVAMDSLRYSYGEDSLVPDYVFLEAPFYVPDFHDKALARLQKDGDSAQLLEILPKVNAENEQTLVTPLVAALLSREPLPVEEAAQMLASEKSRSASVAAQIIGRVGKSAAKKHEKALLKAIEGARIAWSETLREVQTRRPGAAQRLRDIATRYRWLLWAASRLEVAAAEMLAAATLNGDPSAEAIRQVALTTLGEPWVGKEGLKTLEMITRQGDARARAMATAEILKGAPKKRSELLKGATNDQVSMGRITAGASAEEVRSELLATVKDKALAPMVLPRMAALGDIEGLSMAMNDPGVDDTVRRGAIDALSTIVSDDVADLLAKFGADEDHDETLRKAAWRARRRVKRAVAKGPFIARAT